MKSILLFIINLLIIIPFSVIIIPAVIIARLNRNKLNKPRLMWGPTPILSNKYWSEALKQKGYNSSTVMDGLYHINKYSDYDIYIDELIIKTNTKLLKDIIYILRPYYSIIYIIFKFDIIHHPYFGIFLKKTPIWNWEAHILHLAGCKSIALAYGGDFYKYSKVLDPSIRHGLLLNYYNSSKIEQFLEKRNNYWMRYADASICWYQLDGNGRWDVLPFNGCAINIETWKPKSAYSEFNGVNGVVHIAHTPNHRGFKGSEFIIKAIEELQEEGLKINLILIEKKSNDQVMHILQEQADILVEQIIATGYALSGIEGMSSGLAVIAGLENPLYTQVFRRYSYLNECPILSGSPENIKDQIRLLVTNPGLRETLGKANRQYVEKYHSYEAAGHMFDMLYQKIWFGKDADTLNLFHPLSKNSYNNSKPFIQHPLTDNHFKQ
jgi:glycosyltransferase involved in cell wall biosynthesis